MNRIDVDRINRNHPSPGTIKIEFAKLADDLPPFSIGLPGQNESQMNCVITGWGSVETGAQSPVLREAPAQIMSKDFCNELGRNITTRRQSIKRTYTDVNDRFSFCAGQKGRGSDSCKGDSGGPLLCQMGSEWIQAGVVSHGPPGGKCGEYNRPGVYANVAFVMQWIRKITGCT